MADVLTPAQSSFVADRRVAALATVKPDGMPHVVPICTVLDMDRIIFATETDTQKVRNMRFNDWVAICFDEYVEDWTALRQVVVHGPVLFLESGPDFERGRNLLYGKFEQYEAQAPIEEGTSMIVEVPFDRVTAWNV
jgi:nitroimidazol reductase NimA-like FMN-containing flavoprotein (pyridoxamine 5'-phosphate oxidase superfamily)